MLQNYNPGQDGYVTAITTGPVALNLQFSPTNPIVTVSFGTGSLTAGTTIQIFFSNIHPSCPPPGQSPARFGKSRAR